MKLISISIERFGARSNLHLENLSPHLNVVYGPNGSGKTTITQFVRWMLFGSEDASSQRYLAAGDQRLGGVLQIDDGRGQRRTLVRHQHHGLRDDLRVVGAHGEEGYAADARRLTGLDLTAWTHVFSFGFDQPPIVEQLLRAAQGHSFTVTFDEFQLQHLREMLQRLEEMRRDGSWSVGDEHAYASLVDRRRQLRADLEASERRCADQLRERDRTLQTLLAEIAAEQRRLQEARQVLQRTESYLAARSREADEASAAASTQRERWLASRRDELVKLDEQIQQWHQMLGRIRQRHESLQTQMAQGGPVVALAGRMDEADLRAALLSLGHALNDIDEDLRNGGVHRTPDTLRSLSTAHGASPASWGDADLLAEGSDAAGRADFYREILAAAWQSMRDDVHRLCRELQNQQHHAQYAEQARELEHLRRCDAELSSLIEALDRRRASLRSTPELLQRPWERPATPFPRRAAPLDLGPAPRGTHWFDATTFPPIHGARVADASSPEGWTDYRETLGPVDYRQPRVLDDSHSANFPWHRSEGESARGESARGDARHAQGNGRAMEDRHGASVDGHDVAHSSYQVDYRFDVMQHRSPDRNGHSSWNPSPTAGEAVARAHDPVWQARLVHLSRRRDYLASRVLEVEGRLRSLESRRESLQGNRFASDAERSVEALRLELASVEDRLRQLETSQRRREEMQALERQAEQLRQQLAPSEILREASSLLARFTCGSHRTIRVSEPLRVTVEDDRGQWLDQSVLSRGTRDHVYLALALALVAAFRRRDLELPLVLNDIFIHIDGDRAEATAEVLAQFAAQGHQVILFTHQEESLPRFGALGARLYTLRERPRPLEGASAAAWNAPRGYTERLYLDTPLPHAGAPVSVSHAPATHSPVPAPVARPLAPVHPPEVPARGQGEVGRVTEPSRLAEVEWLEATVVDRFATAGVFTVGEFLSLDADEAAAVVAVRGWDAAEMARSQSRLALQCFVGLSPSDASLLVACGVEDPEELAYVDVSDLHRRIEMFLANGDARARYGSIARFERSRLARWIQAARRSHYRRHRPKATPARRPETGRPGTLHATAIPETRPAAVAVEPIAAESPRADVTRAEATRARAAADSPELRVARPRRTEAAPASRPAPVAPEPTSAAETPREMLRFFLADSDPIVDAPSIGPKTAERFQAVGLETVGQLLGIDAAEAAGRINYRRITAELIESWQRQTELVCRVPNLRGHDAQVLVACEVVSAEQLAEQDAATLNARVQEYIGSVEGRRVLRGARTPELSEVAAWIRWAQLARQRTASGV